MKQLYTSWGEKLKEEMKVENTENNRKIQQVAATMAIEDMYMSKDCLQGLIDVANGTKQGVMEELKATDMMR